MNFVSDLLIPGEIYTRDQLKSILDTQDATINTGVFRPAGFDSVLLFVTVKKPSDRTQYVDKLDGDTLHWQGQNSGRTDSLIIEHQERGIELLLFYRTEKYEHEYAGFRFEGKFVYESHEGPLPSSFVLNRYAKLVASELTAEADAEHEAVQTGAFDPTSLEDARKKTFAAIVVRQGQPAFRKALLDAYERRCALTGCDVEPVLEAAHICRYMGAHTNVVSNGLLLRADLHTLYDRALIAIDPATYEVVVAEELRKSRYAFLQSGVLRLPKKAEHQPSQAALLTHLHLVRSIWDKQARAHESV
ncbi:HNH endonuclease [Caballeronia sp. BR00000012568055]|uniref:HNH endonuclease n=1 Tax=Caballeronia sp. BR00000012568055 TaxID=2918761 RepID=UPI0023F9CAA5|nr:HNH endonuclease [Caballeronia sp. BR00000012568055]